MQLGLGRIHGLSLLLLALASVAVPPASAQNLLTNPGFEQGTTNGWFPFGPPAIAASTAEARSGDFSLLVSGRTAPWNGAAQDILSLVTPGETYWIEGWVRLANAGSDDVKATIKQTDGSGDQFLFIAGATATDQGWVRLAAPFTLEVDGTLTTLQLYFEGAAAGVDFYLDDTELDHVDWRAEADASIEAIRKRDADVVPVDALGQPLPGIDVDAAQISHHFPFGSTMNGNVLTNTDYQDFFVDHFEWAVFENESKWWYNEPQEDQVTYQTADAMWIFCDQNDLTVRGHAIFWGVPSVIQGWVDALDDTALQLAVEDRIDSAVAHFDGKFVHWDVNNEMLHGSYFADRLPGIRPAMFQRAHSVDPEAELFVNDFNIITVGEDEAYKAQITELIGQGAPIHGIGVQGHYGSVVEPLSTLDRLDNLATLGLPIWISEYDSLNPDENVRADNLETLYRLAFGHPAVHGILMWGFWAGDHWRGPDAAIVELDWTLNAAGQRYEALLDEWTTEVVGVSDGAGTFSFRGFHGEYEVTLTDGTPSALHTVELVPGSGAATFYCALDPAGCLAPGQTGELTVARQTPTGVSQLSWSAPVAPSGIAVHYDLLASEDPSDFVDSIVCPVAFFPSNVATDPSHLAPGAIRYYLVRARNRCGAVAGPLGNRSDGVPRPGSACPDAP